MKQKYPAADIDALDFLRQVLVFNPYFRITIKQALAHPLFAKVRNEQKESTKGQQVVLEFEKDDLNRERLRELILLECSYFRKKWKLSSKFILYCWFCI